MNSDPYLFKIKYGNMFRRIRDSRFPDFSDYGPDMTFSKLEETIRRIFKLPETFKFDMVYTDNDNDEVTMTDDGDIRDAVVYQKLNPLRVTVLAQESQRSAFDDSLRESLAGDPPSWAADIILKLDQLLLAVNKKSVEPEVDSLNTTKFTRTEQHVLEGEDNSPSDGSTIKPAKDVLPGEEWTDIAQSGYDSEFLRRAMILRQRVTTDELNV